MPRSIAPRIGAGAAVLVPALAFVLALGGCAGSYIVPGPKADLQALAPPSIQDGFAAQASAPFPAAIALAHVQAPGYTNWRVQQAGGAVGSGRYSVVTTRDADDDAQVAPIARLPQVAGVTALNRMLLPARLDSDAELRQAAARLHADLVLVYTFDTAFFDTDAAKMLSVVTLGLSPTRHVAVTTTASALLVDTRTGYVYSTYEATHRADTRATSWGSSDAADELRRQSEHDAFGQLVDELARSWPALLARYAKA